MVCCLSVPPATRTLRQPVFPLAHGFFQHPVEAGGADLGVEVGAGVWHADVGNGQLQLDDGPRAFRVESQFDPHVIAGDREPVTGKGISLPRANRGEGPAEPGDEINLEPAVTRREGAEGADGPFDFVDVGQHAHPALLALATPQHAGGVETNARLGVLGEGVAMHADAPRRRQLDLGPRLGQSDRVVSGKGDFVCVVKAHFRLAARAGRRRASVPGKTRKLPPSHAPVPLKRVWLKPRRRSSR